MKEHHHSKACLWEPLGAKPVETLLHSELGPCLLMKSRQSRKAWIRANGPISSPKIQVLHRCDETFCIQISHLFLGTARENTRDMMAKGRANWQNGNK